MAIVFMVFFFIHCGFTLTTTDYFIVAGLLYGSSWCYSQMKTYFDHGIRRRATVRRVSDRCLRVDIPVGPFTLWTPGQHMFLRFLTFGTHALTAHPFTICSLPDGDKLVGEPQSVMTFYVKPRGGFTGRLAAAAARSAGGSVTVPVLLEGAYGGLHGRPLIEYDRALVVACGSGAGYSLPFVMEWIAAAARQEGVEGVKMAARKKMTVVIATRDAKVVQWYEAAIAEFLAAQMLEIPEGIVDVLVFLTEDAKDSKDMAMAAEDEIHASLPETNLGINVFMGRPDIGEITRNITLEDNASVGMAACGPASVLEAVRDEAAAAELRILKNGPGAKEVYLYSELFGW